MLRSPDSCIAVASAIVTARSGIRRAEPTASMVAAFTACSGSSEKSFPPAVAVQCGASGPAVMKWAIR